MMQALLRHPISWLLLGLIGIAFYVYGGLNDWPAMWIPGALTVGICIFALLAILGQSR